MAMPSAMPAAAMPAPAAMPAVMAMPTPADLLDIGRTRCDTGRIVHRHCRTRACRKHGKTGDRSQNQKPLLHLVHSLLLLGPLAQSALACAVAGSRTFNPT